MNTLTEALTLLLAEQMWVTGALSDESDTEGEITVDVRDIDGGPPAGRYIVEVFPA